MTLNCSIVWDSAPVRQSFGRCLVVFDGVVSVRWNDTGIARDFRVNIHATTGGRNPDAVLRYMTEAKRGHSVPANHLPDVRAYVIAEAVKHLADYRAAYVAEAQARDAAFMAERKPAAPLKLNQAEALGATESPVQTIDVTPTWAAILPLLIAAIENGTATGRQIAREELGRMAALADRYVAAQAALSEVTGKESGE